MFRSGTPRYTRTLSHATHGPPPTWPKHQNHGSDPDDGDGKTAVYLPTNDRRLRMARGGTWHPPTGVRWLLGVDWWPVTRHPYPPAASSCASCTLTAHAAQRAAKAHPTPLISPSIRFPWCHSLGYTTTSQSSSVFHQLPLSLLQRLSAARPSLPKTALNSFSVHADRLTTFSVELLNKGRTTRPIFTGRPPTTIKGGTFFSERQSLFRKKRRQS